MVVINTDVLAAPGTVKSPSVAASPGKSGRRSSEKGEVPESTAAPQNSTAAPQTRVDVVTESIPLNERSG